MGRPLNKKYFGNRNPGLDGSYTAPDAEIGGREVESVDVTVAGSYTGTLPTFTFPTPAIVEGVTATGTLHGKAISATVVANGSGYSYGDTLNQNVSAGNEGLYATWTVVGLKTVTVTINNAGTAVDPGDKFRYSGSYAGGSWTTPLEILITSTDGSGHATGFTVTQAGVWAGAAAPANTIGATRTQIAAGQDYNAADIQFNITSYGVAAVIFATEGDYTAVTSGAKATTATPAGGTGATLNITYGVKNIAIDVVGDGYTLDQDLDVEFTPAGASAVLVLGPEGETPLREPAILLTASTETSTPYANSDIIKQESTAIYKVQNTGGTAFCALQTSTPDAPGEAIMIATDSDGNTYYVVKLCAHLATLVQKTGSNFQFRSMTNPVWTLGDPVENYSVKVTNG